MAVAKLRTLTVYLSAMAEKDAVQYGEDYRVVTEIISRINASRRYGTKPEKTDEEGPVTP